MAGSQVLFTRPVRSTNDIKDVVQTHAGELLSLDLYFCRFYTNCTCGANFKQMQQSRCLQMFD